MKKLYILLMLAACPLISGAGVKYEKPKPIDYKQGDIVITEITEKRASGDTVIQETTTFKSFEIVSGKEIQVWQSVRNTLQPSLSTELYRELRDDDGIFVRYLEGTQDYVGLGVYKIITNNLGNSFSLGDTIIDKTSFRSVSLVVNGAIFTGYGLATNKGVLNNITTVTTNLGNLETYEIEIDSKAEAELGNYTYGLMTYTETVKGTIWYSNTFGEVKSELNVVRVLSDGIDEETDEYTTSSKITSTTINGTTSNITAIGQNELLDANMGGWFWLGQFPWAYNASTGNWNYFYDDQLYIYDNDSKVWMKFDKATQSWSQSN